jgi:hypothetical protein
MLKIATDFSIRYGIFLAYLADSMDGDPCDLTTENVADFFPGTLETLEEDARAAGEFSVIRPWLELLIACSSKDLQAMGIPDVRSHADITLPHPGIGGMPKDQWRTVFEYMRQTLFHLDAPMTEEEKARVKREVTFVTESLEDFRKRMRDEGRLPDSP